MKNLAKVSQKIRKKLFAKNEKIVKLKKNWWQPSEKMFSQIWL